MTRSRWFRIACYVVLAAMTIPTAGIVLFAGGTLFDPATNRFTMFSSSLWPTYGPHFVLLSLLALAAGVAGLRYGPQWPAIATSAVAALALLASTIFTAQILKAIHDAGGSANPITALWLLSPEDGMPDERETYSNAGGQPLEALIFRPKQAAAPAPAMLYLHAGGWITGAAGDTARDLRWFADQGWLVVSVDYRLATESTATWDKAPKDVACALVWLVRNASRFGGDPERIAILGDSSGGNLAINVAYAAALGEADSGCGGEVPVPDAVVVQYPVTDPLNAYRRGYPVPGIEPRRFTSYYIGGTPEEFPARMQAISSATYLSGRAPRTLIIEPEKDGLIPVEGVHDFVEQARASGVSIDVVRIPFANHGYDNEAANSLGNQGRLSITQNYLEQSGLMTPAASR